MTSIVNILPITAAVSVGGVFGWIFGIIALLALIVLGLVFPGRKKDIDEFIGTRYAHRGVHDDKKAENSISAFKAAVDHGFGIELDIRLSKDNKLVVFHDDTLDRVCGREGKVRDFTAAELATFKLSGTEDGIPTFDDYFATKPDGDKAREKIYNKINEGLKSNIITNDIENINSLACLVSEEFQNDFLINYMTTSIFEQYKKMSDMEEKYILNQILDKHDGGYLKVINEEHFNEYPLNIIEINTGIKKRNLKINWR